MIQGHFYILEVPLKYIEEIKGKKYEENKIDDGLVFDRCDFTNHESCGAY